MRTTRKFARRKSPPSAGALFGKTRQALLGLLFTRVDEAFYVRELVRRTGVALGGVQRELRALTAAGVIRRTVQGRSVYYQANPESPVFSELKGLVVKTTGIVHVLRDSLLSLHSHIAVAFVYGSTARMELGKGSDIDLMVVGDVTFAEVVEAIAPAQKRLAREINPTVYPVDEYQKKLAAGHHFLARVADEAKVFVIGDERELERLVGKRLASRASNESRGDSRSAGRRGA
jgi:predicted nucleotidyltransferase